MKKNKRVITLLLCASMFLGLTGCGMSEKQEMTILVQGNIDQIYKGIITEAYLDVIEGTLEECEKNYKESMEIEADYLAYYWGMYEEDKGETFEILEEDLQDNIIEFCEEMLQKTKYKAQEAVPQVDGSYTVKLVIEPLDIMQLADEMYSNDTYEPLNKFWEKYAELDLETLPEAKYVMYTNEYAEIIMQMLWELLPKAGYMESKNQSVQIEMDTDGKYAINEDDWTRINETLVYYP